MSNCASLAGLRQHWWWRRDPCASASSAWAVLAGRAELAAGSLILGATGVTGQMAVPADKLLGAGRVVAAGHNERVLGTLHELDTHAVLLKGLPVTAFMPLRFASIHRFLAAREILFLPSAESLPR